MREKMRTPTIGDHVKTIAWLDEAKRQLNNNEYHRVKQLCRQIIRVLARKEKERSNDQAHGRALARPGEAQG